MKRFVFLNTNTSVPTLCAGKSVWLLTSLFCVLLLWSAASAIVTPYAAYVYSSDSTTAGNYKSFLDGVDLYTDLVPMSSIASTDFSPYTWIIIGPETGSMQSWGTAGQVSTLDGSGKKIMGLGEGGYAFFGQLTLSIGFPYGAHGSGGQVTVINPGLIYFHSPNVIGLDAANAANLYANGSPVVEIYRPNVNAADVIVAVDTAVQDYVPIAIESGRYCSWGFENGPTAMTNDGRGLFQNLLQDVPEPATLAMLAMGSLFLYRRTRRA